MHLAVDQAPIGPRWFESIRTHPLERCRVVIVSAKNRKQLRRFRSAANGGAGRSPRACLAQLAERRLDKAEAPGSNPGASTSNSEFRPGTGLLIRPRAGSNPLAPINFLRVWRNWQTSRSQKPVSCGTCEFDSHHAYHLSGYSSVRAERLPWAQEAEGSNPSIQTSFLLAIA